MHLSTYFKSPLDLVLNSVKVLEKQLLNYYRRTTRRDSSLLTSYTHLGYEFELFLG